MQGQRPAGGLDAHHRRPVLIGCRRLAQDGGRQRARLPGNRFDIAAALPVDADAIAQRMDAGYAGLQRVCVHRNALGPIEPGTLRQALGGTRPAATTTSSAAKRRRLVVVTR